MGVLNIVLHEPEIPANTGNIGRTCVATGTRLHLIEPLGFRLNEKAIKRAGMDYWEHLDVTRYLDYEDFLKKGALSASARKAENAASNSRTPLSSVIRPTKTNSTAFSGSSRLFLISCRQPERRK